MRNEVADTGNTDAKRAVTGALRRIAVTRPHAAATGAGAESAAAQVQMLVLAVDLLAPASFRASFIGKPVTVTAPDAATAALFRAALRETQMRRPTDRLIEVAVAGQPSEAVDSGPASVSGCATRR